MNEDAFVILWSPLQDSFHIETIREMLKTNRRIYASRKHGAFIVLGFASSRDEATETVSFLLAQPANETYPFMQGDGVSGRSLARVPDYTPKTPPSRTDMISQTKITERTIVAWKDIFSKREYEYLTHVINGLLEKGEFDEILIQYGEKNGRRVLHIFEPFCTLNFLGYASPSVVSISFNDVSKIEFFTGGDNGLEIFSTDVTLERTVSFPRNSTPEIDFWHFVDAIGDAAS